MKGVRRFQTRGKLAPTFIGPFPFMTRVGVVAYQLELPPELSDMHNVFHVFTTATVHLTTREKDQFGRDRAGKGLDLRREASENFGSDGKGHSQ